MSNATTSGQKTPTGDAPTSPDLRSKIRAHLTVAYQLANSMSDALVESKLDSAWWCEKVPSEPGHPDPDCHVLTEEGEGAFRVVLEELRRARTAAAIAANDTWDEELMGDSQNAETPLQAALLMAYGFQHPALRPEDIIFQFAVNNLRHEIQEALDYIADPAEARDAA